MTNFSSFFPAAGGGGGFTKMNKYATYRALDDATHKMGPAITGESKSTSPIGDTTIVFDNWTPQNDTFTNVANSMVGYTFTHNSTVHTVTANPAFIKYGVDPTFTFTPGLTAVMNNNTPVNFIPLPHTVNPATDLGLSDGDSLGYFLCGAGYANSSGGGKGGKINQGTAIISNASTDLVLTPGAANGNNSTITGGLTLSSGDGSNMAGPSDVQASNDLSMTGSSSVMGYGVGGGDYNSNNRAVGSQNHGWGGGGFKNDVAGDGAILLFY